MQAKFVPDSFTAPEEFESNSFYFTTLDRKVAELDYEAVMSSRERLKSIFGPGSDWPRKDMTLEDNIASLQAHELEFKSRKAFAYSVFNVSKNKCLGSVYIDPSQSSNFDCEVYLWIRDDNLSLEQELYKTVVNWLQSVWPFARIAFPGRDISWENWDESLKAV